MIKRKDKGLVREESTVVHRLYILNHAWETSFVTTSTRASLDTLRVTCVDRSSCASSRIFRDTRRHVRIARVVDCTPPLHSTRPQKGVEKTYNTIDRNPSHPIYLFPIKKYTQHYGSIFG